MKCKYVSNHLLLNNTINATNSEEFINQFKSLLNESRPYSSIVYVIKTHNPFPRGFGVSPILYIGKAKSTLFSRYRSIQIYLEVTEYWERYKRYIEQYGQLEMEIHLTSNPTLTENNFLYNYHCKHSELPPLNRKSFNRALLESDSLTNEPPN